MCRLSIFIIFSLMLFKVKSQGRGAWRPIQNTKLGKWNSGLGSNFYPAKENSIVSNWQSRNSLNAQSVTNKTPFIKPLSSGKWNVESSLSNEVLDFDKYPENSNSDLGNVKYSKSSDTDNNKPNYSSAWGGQNDVLAWNSNKNSNDANYDGAKWESKQSKNNRKNKWDLNESKDNKPKKEKVSNTKTTMGLSNWGTTTTTPSYDSFVDEKPYKNQFGGQSNSFNTKNKKNGNSAFKDTSILDELDKNDWYLETSSNVKIPEIIADSNVNIDVRELWDFDKRRGLTANFGRSSKRRRNRHVESSKCECVDVNLCNEEDIIMDERTAETDDWRNSELTRCKKLTQICCTKPKVPLKCGQRRVPKNADLEGDVAEGGEFPWLLKLETLEEDVGCGASLIHSRMALTSAHCTSRIQSNNLFVRGGIWNSNDELFQIRKISEIILHPDYNSEHPRNDIALLVLEQPFEITDNVNTICLPITNDRWDTNNCFVAGWGAGEMIGEGSEVLKKGAVTFLPQPDCQNIMLITDLWRKYILHDSFVCGIEKNRRSPCMGDEGSPVVCQSQRFTDTYLQVGVVSKSMNCDDFGRPGIFTNVLKFIDWANEIAMDLGLLDENQYI